MDINIKDHLNAVKRSVSYLDRNGSSASAITLVRSYDTKIEELWDIITNIERIPRWFLKISGELKLGGHFQLEGNAGGTITMCKPPSHVAMTWEFAGDTSWVDLQLSNDGSHRTQLTLMHIAHLSPHWDQYGPGATGVGWEGGFLGLALYLTHPNKPKLDESTFATSSSGRAFYVGSSEMWGEAAIANGTDTNKAKAAVKQTTGFYTGESVEPA